MKVKQISVFLENKGGRLQEVTSVLAAAKINMSAFCVAETPEFGVLRMITSAPDETIRVLKEHRFAASLTDVICVSCPDVPGAMSRILDILADHKQDIEYMYAFSTGQNAANVIIRPTNIELCIRVLQENKVQLIGADVLYRL